jgi:hypothetical protein
VAHTVSGDITATGSVLAFSSDGVSGNVFLDLADTPDLVKINSVSGTVTARLEADVATSYAINTVSGRLQLDDAALRVRGKFTGKVGVLEGRWTDFRANTVSGDISVMHVARTEATAPAETPTP